MRFRTPAFAFIVEAFSNKHKQAKGIVDDSEPSMSPVRESILVAEEKPLPVAPTVPAIPNAPKPLAVLETYQIDEDAAEYLVSFPYPLYVRRSSIFFRSHKVRVLVGFIRGSTWELIVCDSDRGHPW